MPRPVAVSALEPYQLWLRYDDGAEGVVDLSALRGRGLFAAWEEPGVWENASLGEAGQVQWERGLDLCPDELYLRLTGSPGRHHGPRGGTAGLSMNDEDFASLLAGAREALTHAQGDDVSGSMVHAPVDVRAVRRALGMSQEEFAASFGFSVATVRHWEQGRRHPRGPARTLLIALAHEPRAVLRALAAESGADLGAGTPPPSDAGVQVELTPAQADQLRALASDLGVTPAALASAAVRELLCDADLEAAARRVLEKNAELYRRLA